jgi:4-hydroxy-3-methylbut-2-en-1-yl diphosphate synthase IspG/GcpE
MLDDNNPPQTISVPIIDYIHHKLKGLEDKTKLEFDKIRLEIGALKDEYQKSEKLIAEAKESVDKHFEAINNLQVRLDKQSMTLVTKDDVSGQIELALSKFSQNVSGELPTIRFKLNAMIGITSLISVIVVGCLMAHIMGKI